MKRLVGTLVLLLALPLPAAEFDAKEFSRRLAAVRSNTTEPERALWVSATYLTARCSATESTWMRNDRALLRLQEEYFPLEAVNRWHLWDLTSGWNLRLEKQVPGLEFASVEASAQPSKVADFFLAMHDAGKPVRIAVTVAAGRAEPFRFTVEDEEPVAGVLAAAEQVGRLAAWRRAAPSGLFQELNALRTLECARSEGECHAFEPWFELAAGLLGSPVLDSVEWTEVETTFHRGTAEYAAAVGLEPLAGSACRFPGAEADKP